MTGLVVLLANVLLYVVAAGAVLAWIRAPRSDWLPFAVAGVCSAVLVAVAVKAAGLLWNDPRPFVVDGQPPWFPHPADNGFPSDHTTLAVAVAAVVWTRNKAAGLVLMALALLLGATRVIAHVHHVPDIIGGALIGLVCAAVGVLVAKRVRPRISVAA